MIKRVKLTNWKSHLNSEFLFSKGTNALLGHIGSGKSSVLDAICFALFGTFPSLQNRKIKLDDVIMKKPVEKDKATVEVEFEFNEKTYLVKRVIERRKGTTYSEIRENGKLLEAPNSSRVTQVIQDILQIDYELFSKAIYSEQNEIDFFLKMRRGQRMKKIDELLYIDKFENARSSCVSLRNRISDRISEKSLWLKSRDRDKISEEIKKLKEEINEYENAIKKSLEEVEKLKKELSLLDQELKVLKIKKENLDKISAKLKTLKELLEKKTEERKQLKESIKELEESVLEEKIKDLEDKEKEIKLKLDEINKGIEKFRVEISSLKVKKDLKLKDLEESLRKIKRREELERRIAEIKKGLPENLEAELKNLEERISELESEMTSLKEKIKIENEALEKIKSSESVCPVCERPLESELANKLIERKMRKIKEMENLLPKIKNNLETLRNKKRKLEDAKREMEILTVQKDSIEVGDINVLKSDIEKLTQQITVKTSALEKSEKEREELNEELEKIEKEIEELRKVIQNFERLKNLTKEIEELSLEVNQLEIEKKKLEEGFSISRLSELEESVRITERKIEKSKAEAEKNKEIIEEKKKLLKKFEDELKELEKIEKEIDYLEKIVSDLKIFERALIETQVQLRKFFIGAINTVMNQIWETLYPYKDFSGIKIEIEENDYVLKLIERSGRVVNVEGNVSGGERSLAALTLRIALSLVLAPHIRILVLDEPTHNLDQKSIEDFARTLREKINEFVDQVFIISHNPEILDAINGYAYRLERNKSIDEPTKIERII